MPPTAVMCAEVTASRRLAAIRSRAVRMWRQPAGMAGA